MVSVGEKSGGWALYFFALFLSNCACRLRNTRLVLQGIRYFHATTKRPESRFLSFQLWLICKPTTLPFKLNLSLSLSYIYILVLVNIRRIPLMQATVYHNNIDNLSFFICFQRSQPVLLNIHPQHLKHSVCCSTSNTRMAAGTNAHLDVGR